MSPPRDHQNADTLLQTVKRVAGSYYRLALLVGPHGSGKTTALRLAAEEIGAPIVNLNLGLSARLLELTKKRRALRARRCLEEELADIENDPVLVDNIELLFDRNLAQDPLRLLQGMARNRTIVATWPGVFDGVHLAYAEPNHPEWRRYANPDASIITTDGIQHP